MSVYAGDKAEYLQEAIDSIYANTLLPSEFVLVVDDPVKNEKCVQAKKQFVQNVIKDFIGNENEG